MRVTQFRARMRFTESVRILARRNEKSTEVDCSADVSLLDLIRLGPETIGKMRCD